MIVRARILHTPRDPFSEDGALEWHADGGLAMADGRILACGDFAAVRAEHPGLPARDERDALLLPGLVDTHVHYPQLTVLGAMGLPLLEWLVRRALPAEARLADPARAATEAEEFVRGLAANGTTAALVFGSHFPAAQEALFAAAQRCGLRVTSGLVVSDRGLLPKLHVDAQTAYEQSAALAARWHGRGRLRYAVTPRYSLSCTEAMLECCGALRAERRVAVTSHVNESLAEVAAVREQFGWARDYLDTYERYGLVGPDTVLAHDVHVTDAELRRLADARASVAHCPSSNACLASGYFPFVRHVAAGVRVALGTDVGAGTSLSLFAEGLMAYQTQRLTSAGFPLRPRHLLYLATLAGARALGLGAEIGCLSPGKAADFLLVRPRGLLAAALRGAESPEDVLGALFTVARADSIAEVRVAGEVVA